MAMPEAFASATSIDLSAELELETTMSAAGQPWTEASCPLAEQEQDEWCWASVGEGVRKRYKEPPFLSQCQVANKVKIGVDCCSPGLCNSADSLSSVLEKLGHRRGDEIDGAMDFDAVYDEIAADHPICCFIDHQSKIDHFVVITGAGLVDGVRTVGIVDPGEGREHETPVEIAYGAFLGYDGGNWKASYKTKKMSEA